jgi:hypothetical protein
MRATLQAPATYFIFFEEGVITLVMYFRVMNYLSQPSRLKVCCRGLPAKKQTIRIHRSVSKGVRKMSEIEDLSELIGKPSESVPVVDAADLKTMWAYGQKLKAEHGGMAVGMSVWKQILAPGVDIRAVGYRIGVLSMLEMMLRAAWTLGEPTENAFKVAARMDLNWPQVGVVHNGFLFNLEGFLAEVQYEAFIQTSGKADK